MKFQQIINIYQQISTKKVPNLSVIAVKFTRRELGYGGTKKYVIILIQYQIIIILLQIIIFRQRM